MEELCREIELHGPKILAGHWLIYLWVIMLVNVNLGTFTSCLEKKVPETGDYNCPLKQFGPGCLIDVERLALSRPSLSKVVLTCR